MDPAGNSHRPVSGLAAQRACDECRTRKIRCDRTSPCSHCRAANLICRTTTQRSREHRDRVQVTKQYETKIDRIESRLANIEQLLRNSNNTSSSPSTHQTSASSLASNTPSNYSANNSHPDHDSSTQTPITDNVGLRVESLTAKNVLEHAVGRDAAVQQDPQLMSALESLRAIVNRIQLDTSSTSKSSAALLADAASEAVLPGWEQVKMVLDRGKKGRPMAFDLLSHGLYDDFCRKCRSMYRDGQEAAPRDKLLVYSSLANICSEYSGVDGGESAAHNHNLAKGFSYLLLQALETFPMLTPASLDTAEALMVTILTTVSLCKPSLSSSLLGIAARMCQTLGYNRLSRTDPNTDPLFHRKVMLFWGLYVMDRHNSLILGLAPAIQDYDIDTPMITASDEYSPEIVALMRFWVECGRVQGKICTQLYGPAASSLAPDERARIAEVFACELEDIRRRKIQANSDTTPFPTHGIGKNSVEIWIHGDSIMHLSTLTTALCVIPSNHPRHFRAIGAARDCLRISKDMSKNYSGNIYGWASCCNWVLLRTPLTPFAGVFYNVIANPQSSQEDLKLLEDFTISLKPACGLSDSIEKLYQLCSIFAKVARAYVRAKTQQRSTSDERTRLSPGLQPVIGEFDEHLTALGFGPPGMTTSNNADPADGVDFNNMSVDGPEQQGGPFDATGLQDWYSGNVSMYSLLEQDFNELYGMDFGNFGEGSINH